MELWHRSLVRKRHKHGAHVTRWRQHHHRPTWFHIGILLILAEFQFYDYLFPPLIKKVLFGTGFPDDVDVYFADARDSLCR